MGSLLPDFIERFGARLRFPVLFWITATLFALDLVLPDLLPFADELLLGLGTLLLASWKRRRAPERDAAVEAKGGQVIDVEPEP